MRLGKFILPRKTWSFGPPAPLPARRAYRPEGRAYASESQVRDRWLCLGVLCLKSQILSTKLQINLKLQITNSKQGPKPFFLFFCLLFRISVIGIYLLFVICYLGFPLSVTPSAGAHAAQAPALRVRRVSDCFFVWDFEFRSLLFICFLGFVIWNFNKSMNF